MIKIIVQNSGRRVKDIAAEVFPGQRNPVRTLTRLMKGVQKVDVDTMIRICRSCGVSASEVVGRWRVGNESDMLTFVKGEARAEISPSLDTLRVFRKGSLVYEGSSEGLLPDSTVPELERMLEEILKTL